MPLPAIRKRALMAFTLLTACSEQLPTRPPSTRPAMSILTASDPAAGSTVPGPVNSLQLHFNPPARIDEVTITGPDGAMPMMIHSIGEVSDYSVPLPGLSPGSYAVAWKGFSGGSERRGSFSFSVR